MNFPRPIPDSYWVKPGQFLAGEYPGSSEAEETVRIITAFLEAGFTDFIDLTQPHELAPYEIILRDLSYMYDVRASYSRISIRDFSVPPRETMQAILSKIDNALANGRKIYLHCWGGVGRTGTTVGCYLVHHGMTGEQALRQLAEWWSDVPKRISHPTSPENREQIKYILRWSEDPPPKREREIE